MCYREVRTENFLGLQGVNAKSPNDILKTNILSHHRLFYWFLNTYSTNVFCTQNNILRTDFIIIYTYNAFIFPYFCSSKITAYGKFRVYRTYFFSLAHLCTNSHTNVVFGTIILATYTFGWQLLNLRNLTACSAHAIYYRARSTRSQRCATCEHSKTWFSC